MKYCAKCGYGNNDETTNCYCCGASFEVNRPKTMGNNTMKYCAKCGKRMDGNALMCPFCGAQTGQTNVDVNYNPPRSNDLARIAQIIIIITCIILGFACLVFTFLMILVSSIYGYLGFATYSLILIVLYIKLGINIAMAVSLSNKINSGKPISIGYKICTLLFISMIAGTILLCSND